MGIDMPLTADQKTKIKEILTKYKQDVRALVKQHKADVVKTVGEMDKKRTEEIHRLIERS